MKTYLPSIMNNYNQMDNERQELFNKIKASPLQKRLQMNRHPLLDKAAQNKADDMVAKHYFSHTSPDGVSANANIRSTGYILPDWYPLDGNNCESWALVSSKKPEETLADVAIQLWTDSPVHFKHVFGQIDFYKNQECIGVGEAVTDAGGTIFVFLSALCME